MTSPFHDWKNATGVARGALSRHSLSKNHLECAETAVAFVAVMEKRRPSIMAQLSDKYDEQVQQNTKALIAIVDVIQMLVKQGLALRGHHWNKETKREDGNFSMMVDFLAKYFPDLCSHLSNSARYLSPKIQNEFIDINCSLIQKAIVDECNQSLFWSVMIDETTDMSKTEQVSLCVRYIKREKFEIGGL